MPKKRIYNFKQVEGLSSSSAHAGCHPHGAASNDESTASVNDRLNELRKLDAPEALRRKREFAASVNQPSVPPELRSILGVPDVAPPKPRTSIRLRERMRIPGPAPPKSWLGFQNAWGSTSNVRTGKRERTSLSSEDCDRQRPKHLFRFARLIGEDVGWMQEQPPRLLHLTLKRLALRWDSLDEADYPVLQQLSLGLRIHLLTYIGQYGPPLTITGLQALLWGGETIETLDLASLAGYGQLGLRRLARLLDQERSSKTMSQQADVAESWDSADATQSTLHSVPSACTFTFTNLTHLCLSHPPSTASWRDLLFFARCIPQVTHVSLAYWPRPTLTPSLTAATISHRHGPDVQAGGSHYYSTIDNDMREPAALLRQLSNHLLCLQWLDVEGCADWFPAFAELAHENPTSADDGFVDGWAPRPSAISVFFENWSKLAFIRCAQGWLPSRMELESSNPPTLARFRSAVFHSVPDDPVRMIGERADESGDSYRSDVSNGQSRKATIWIEAEIRLLRTGYRINTLRRAHNFKPVTIDLGWIQKAV